MKSFALLVSFISLSFAMDHNKSLISNVVPERMYYSKKLRKEIEQIEKITYALDWDVANQEYEKIQKEGKREREEKQKRSK